MKLSEFIMILTRELANHGDMDVRACDTSGNLHVVNKEDITAVPKFNRLGIEESKFIEIITN